MGAAGASDGFGLGDPVVVLLRVWRYCETGLGVA